MSQVLTPIQGRWVYQNDPQLFDTLRKRTLSHLQAALGRVLGKADDWLFDLAQKDGAVAGSPPLDAMRVLRLSRTPLENAFTKHFEQGFEALQQQITAKKGGQVLSLVEADPHEAIRVVIREVAKKNAVHDCAYANGGAHADAKRCDDA